MWLQVHTSAHGGSKSDTKSDTHSAAVDSETVAHGDSRLEADDSIPCAEADAVTSLACTVDALPMPASLSGSRRRAEDTRHPSVVASEVVDGDDTTDFSNRRTFTRVSR